MVSLVTLIGALADRMALACVVWEEMKLPVFMVSKCILMDVALLT